MEYKLSSFKFDKLIQRDDKHLAIMRINALRSACPSDANFTGTFQFDGKAKYSGALTVLFSRGEFSASVDGSSMEILMEALGFQIKKQIELWRETRFQQKETFVNFGEKAK